MPTDCSQCGAPLAIGGEQGGTRGLWWSWCRDCGCLYIQQATGDVFGLVPSWSRSRLCVPRDAVSFVLRDEEPRA
jgi:hypothetical protein